MEAIAYWDLCVSAVFFAFGSYVFLFAQGVLRGSHKNAEQIEDWLAKHGRTAKIGATVVMGSSVVRICAVLMRW